MGSWIQFSTCYTALSAHNSLCVMLISYTLGFASDSLPLEPPDLDALYQETMTKTLAGEI